MSTSFDLPDLDHFITGAVGEPGSRVFYLQAVAGSHVFTLRLEKLQVATLADYLTALLADIPGPADREIPTNIGLIEPAVAEWVVGQIGVAYDETTHRIIVVAQEMVSLDQDDLDQEDALDPDTLVEGATASFRLTPAQVAAFIRQAGAAVSAGRPACMLCGRPMDPEGHVCIKTNGHKPH
ncbi:MAG: DUF3090 domain-containing protein [Actinobacteria bacterium]|nr:DUF3090 domain-containing protein [Actinomycetota bacterium]